MKIYRRVECPRCSKYVELRKDDDKIKKTVCTRCGNLHSITDKNSNYYVDYSYGGRRFRENVGPCKATAENILAKIKVEIVESKFLDIRKEHKIKFDSFADEYIEVYAKVNNISWKRSILPNLKSLKRFFGNRYLTDITSHLIEKYKLDRLKEVSPAATNRALTLLKSMFNRAIEWEKFDTVNPVTKIKFLREENHKLRYLDKEEIKRLIEHCEDSLRPMIIVALNTGMRKAELFNLKWQDIDFNNGTIHLLKTKNGEKREIPMNEAVKSAVVSAKKHPESAYVFCTKMGKPYTDIRKPFARSLIRAGIKDCLLHTLRHTFASQLAMAGVDLNTIRDLMGHQSTRMTIRYAHLSSTHKNHAVEMLNRRIETVVDTQLTPSIIVESKKDVMNDLTSLSVIS